MLKSGRLYSTRKLLFTMSKMFILNLEQCGDTCQDVRCHDVEVTTELVLLNEDVKQITKVDKSVGLLACQRV